MDRGEMTVPQEEMARQAEFAAMVRALPHRPGSYHVVTYGCQMNAQACWKRWGWWLPKSGRTPIL